MFLHIFRISPIVFGFQPGVTYKNVAYKNGVIQIWEFYKILNFMKSSWSQKYETRNTFY